MPEQLRKTNPVLNGSLQPCFRPHPIQERRYNHAAYCSRLTPTKRYVSPYEFALVHIEMADKNKAFAYQEEAFADRSSWSQPALRPAFCAPLILKAVFTAGRDLLAFLSSETFSNRLRGQLLWRQQGR